MSDDDSWRPVPQQPNITIVNNNANTQINGRNNIGCGTAIAVGILVMVVGAALHSATGGIIVVFGVMAVAAYLIYEGTHPRKQLPKSPPPVRHYHGNILHAHQGGDRPHKHRAPGDAETGG